MSEQQDVSSTLSRREFVAATTATAAAAALPGGAALAQGGARYHRRNISKPGFPARVLDSYKKAIRAMLALPPTDARNWYRNALIHTMDCPHGNWWFPVWHRGYLGWFEQTCRELSGDPDFALPYWDWTLEPKIPDAMFDDVLTPENRAYIASFNDFKTAFSGPIDAFWSTLSDDQKGVLVQRGVRFPLDLWWDIENYPMFFDRDKSRGLTRAAPNLDPSTQTAVSLTTILSALSPRDYITFGSAKTLSHGNVTGFSPLEHYPHNRVHNSIGGLYLSPPKSGFMQDNMSPVDPIFFLHHGNIDRLWDVWTRKQQALNLPTQPTGSDLPLWQQEKFLFYVDAKGQPVTAKATAGDYAAIGDFNYDYEAGSGETIVPTGRVAAGPPRPIQSFNATIADRTIGGAKPAGGSVSVPPALLGAASNPQAPVLFAKVTVALPPRGGDHDLTISLDGGAGQPAQELATVSMFGRHIMHCPVTFTLPLSGALNTLRSIRGFSAAAPLNIRVAPPMTAGMTMTGHTNDAKAEVLSIVVEAH